MNQRPFCICSFRHPTRSLQVAQAPGVYPKTGTARVLRQKKRFLQAVAWIFFMQSQAGSTSWKRFYADWAVLSCDIREVNLAPKTRLKSVFFLDSQRMVFKRSTPDCLAPVDVDRESWQLPHTRVKRVVEGPSGNPIDPPCGPATLAFTCGSRQEPQLARKITYSSVWRQIEEQGQRFNLPAYIVEFQSVSGYARFKRSTWEVFLDSLKLKPLIRLRFRKVRVVITHSGDLV